jgi:hypothetical protein
MYLMTRILKFLGIGTRALAIAVLVIGVAIIIPEAVAQNSTKKGSREGGQMYLRMQPMHYLRHYIG